MKRKDFINEISALSIDELNKKSREMAEEGMKLRFRQASGQLDRGHLLSELRKNYARLQTVRTAKAMQASAEKA